VIRRIIRKKKRDRQKEFVALEQDYLIEEKDEQILQLSPDELLVALRKRKLLANEVVRAYSAKVRESCKSFMV